MEQPKYNCGDKVRFNSIFKGVEEIKTGEIVIVDRYGTFEQSEEPSYDIMVTDADGEQCLWKHVRQSHIIGKE